MRKYLNGTNVPLSVAVFLATDKYDHDSETISATALIKPVRQLVLAGRVPQSDSLVDISGLFKSRMGTALHDSIESAWINNYKQAMQDLGYPNGLIKKIRVNPDPDKLEDGDIPVYLEIRPYKEISGKKVSGKFDFVAEGRVEDFKSTSVFMFTKGTKDDDYKLQGSIYRWLNPKIITADEIAINFLLTDFMPGRAANDPSYPKSPTPQKRIPLLSVAETEAFVAKKLAQVAHYYDAPEEEIPHCSDQELWRSDTVWKYYAKEDAKRATKDFKTDRTGAYAHLAKQGKGLIREIPGEVMACKYCASFPVCTQKDALIADGSLKL